MTVYHVAVHEVLHTCPAWDKPHAVEIRRTVLDVVPGGPCRTPVEVADGVLIRCDRILRRDKQCLACKVQIIVRETTVEDLGHQDPRISEPDVFCPVALFEVDQ